MTYTTVEKTEVNETYLDAANTATNQKHLIAKWIVIDGKIICKWNIA